MSRLTAEYIAHQLDKPHKSGDSWKACCPAHNDKNPSLSIKDGPDGKVLIHCHSGCAPEAVIEELKARRLWPERDQPIKPKTVPAIDKRIVMPVPIDAPKPDFVGACGGQPEAVYAYLDAESRTLGFQCRISLAEGGKRFLPMTCWADGAGDLAWQKKSFPEPRPLYGLDELARNAKSTVMVVEGEKTADAARLLLPQFAVVSWPNGAKAVAGADWSVLKNRDVLIWPDNDDPGLEAAATIRALCECAGARSIRIVALPPELPKKWDLADEVPPGINVEALIAEAPLADSTLARFVLTARQMRSLEIPAREYLIEPFLPVGGLMMVYAKRGLGKTWFGLTLGLAVARGEGFLSYAVPQPRRVLYIDGEMTLAELKERLDQLDGPRTDDLLFLSAEKLAYEKLSININQPSDQERIDLALEKLERNGNRPHLIILDNLSSLGRGVDENDNSALDGQLSWLVSLRHRGYAVILIHHAGKSGDQRGASRREDVLDTTIRLEPPDDDDTADKSGATFIMEFTKTRGRTPDPIKQRLALRPGSTGHLEWQFARAVKPRPWHQTLLRIYEGARELDGVVRPFRDQKHLGSVLGASKGNISKHLTALVTEGLVFPWGGGMRVTMLGEEKLQLFFGVKAPGCPGIVLTAAEENRPPI